MTEMINNKITHNKKRNVGLVYEFFTRYISKAILEHRETDVNKAKIIIKKHFNKSTDLYKELRLFKTLRESSFDNRDSAIHLINRVREIVKNQSQSRLDLEKTGLIHEINQGLSDQNFFNQNITNYKVFGTIQTLLNSWRNSEILLENLSVVSQLEEVLIQHLLTNKKQNNVIVESVDGSQGEVNNLVINIMTDKINKKFESLNESQKKIINLYVFQDENESAKKELVSILENIKSNMLKVISQEKDSVRLNEIHEMLKNEYTDTSNVSDDLVTFYLGVSKLEEELKNG
jgi:hypothetical protein